MGCHCTPSSQGAKSEERSADTGSTVGDVAELTDGRWAAFEVKLGPGQVEDAAAKLRTFAERVDTAECGAPVTLGVIVATGYGYRRADGIAVIPIGALGP